MAAEQHEQTDAKEQASEEHEMSPKGTNSNGSTLRRAAAGGALAAAAGTTVYLTRKAMRNNQGAASEEIYEGDAQSVGDVELSKTGNRVDDFFTVLRERGWDAANDMLIPVAENAAKMAGAYAAANSPDLVRDTLLPKFVDGFTEAQQQVEESTAS